MKVLIVDDSAPMRAVIRNILAELGCRIRDCDNGLAAVAQYRYCATAARPLSQSRIRHPSSARMLRMTARIGALSSTIRTFMTVTLALAEHSTPMSSAPAFDYFSADMSHWA